MVQEMFDVLDEQGNKTGEALPKEVAHDQELWHGSVHVWIMDKYGNILLQFRAANKKIFPSCWDTSVAGHIDAGESPEDTAIREVGEEIGMIITQDELKFEGRFSEQLQMITGRIHREHNSVFTVQKDFKLDGLKIETKELTELKLVSPEELGAILGDPNRRRELSGHRDELFRYAINRAISLRAT